MAGPYEFGWGPADDDESVATIRRAVDAGINWIDSAAIYGFGHSEDVVGQAIQPLRVGEEVYVFTKCGRRWRDGPEGREIHYDLTPAAIREECEASLRRLGVERIDLYQFHWPDYETGTPVEESWSSMGRLVEEGKVRWAGVSNFTVGLLERCAAIRHVDCLQPPLSLLNRYARDEVIPWCARNGTGVIVYSPLASGLLTGAFGKARLHGLPADDWRRRAPMFREPKLSQNLALVERLRPIAERLGTCVSALAVAWVLSVRGVTGAIVGARRPGQIDDWLAAGDLELPASALEEIERALEETCAGTAEGPVPPGVTAERVAEVAGERGRSG